MGIVKLWNKLPNEDVKSPLLEIFSVIGQGSGQSDLSWSCFKWRVGADDLWKFFPT